MLIFFLSFYRCALMCKKFWSKKRILMLCWNIATCHIYKYYTQYVTCRPHLCAGQTLTILCIVLLWVLTVDRTGSHRVPNRFHAVRLSEYTCWQDLVGRHPAVRRSAPLFPRAVQPPLEPTPPLSTCLLATICDRRMWQLCHAGLWNFGYSVPSNGT